MAKKDFEIQVGGGSRFAADATIRYMSYGMSIDLVDVESEDIVSLVTPEEIAERVDLSDMLKALVKANGLGELIYALVENNDTTEIIKEVYGADDDAVRSWVVDTFGSEE